MTYVYRRLGDQHFCAVRGGLPPKIYKIYVCTKRLYISAIQHDVTFQKTVVVNVARRADIPRRNIFV